MSHANFKSFMYKIQLRRTELKPTFWQHVCEKIVSYGNRFRGDTYLREYLAEKILTKTPGRKGGEGARIRNDSQEGKN